MVIIREFLIKVKKVKLVFFSEISVGYTVSMITSLSHTDIHVPRFVYHRIDLGQLNDVQNPGVRVDKFNILFCTHFLPANVEVNVCHHHICPAEWMACEHDIRNQDLRNGYKWISEDPCRWIIDCSQLRHCQ